MRGTTFAVFWAGSTYFVYTVSPEGLTATMVRYKAYIFFVFSFLPIFLVFILFRFFIVFGLNFFNVISFFDFECTWLCTIFSHHCTASLISSQPHSPFIFLTYLPLISPSLILLLFVFLISVKYIKRCIRRVRPVSGSSYRRSYEQTVRCVRAYVY